VTDPMPLPRVSRPGGVVWHGVARRTTIPNLQQSAHRSAHAM
jgi:hypothetical protein